MGVDEDPYTFFIELLKLASSIQLVSIGVLYYTAELGLHYDSGG